MAETSWKHWGKSLWIFFCNLIVILPLESEIDLGVADAYTAGCVDATTGAKG